MQKTWVMPLVKAATGDTGDNTETRHPPALLTGVADIAWDPRTEKAEQGHFINACFHSSISCGFLKTSEILNDCKI